jgi:hypothetical protein
VDRALRLDRESAFRSGCLLPSAPRAARSKRTCVRSEGWSLEALHHGPSPLDRRWRADRLVRRFASDREFVGLKITLLVAMGLLTALLELPR